MKPRPESPAPRAGRRRRPADARTPVWLTPHPVRRWMRHPVVTIAADAFAGDAAELMRGRKIRHLPVVDRANRLVGIVTDRDLRQVVFDPAVAGGEGDLDETLGAITVRDVMTWGVLTVRASSDIREAARLMRERKVGALPVVEDGRVVGMLSETDVLRALEELLRSDVTRAVPAPESPRGRGTYDFGFPAPAEDDPWENQGPGD
jgi:acetoin utilization protein AcuB